jgi:hypothetical protein
MVVVATLGARAIWDEQLMLPSVGNTGFDQASELISEVNTEKRASPSASLIPDDQAPDCSDSKQQLEWRNQ